MSKTFRPWDVDQVWLLPPSIQDLVPPGHMAHFVRATVRTGLDLSRIMECLRRGARLSALSSWHDGGAAALCVQPGDLLVAQDRAGLRGAAGFCGRNRA